MKTSELALRETDETRWRPDFFLFYFMYVYIYLLVDWSQWPLSIREKGSISARSATDDIAAWAVKNIELIRFRCGMLKVYCGRTRLKIEISAQKWC